MPTPASELQRTRSSDRSARRSAELSQKLKVNVGSGDGAAAFATCHVARAESETIAALYEKAKAEGGLSIYGGGPIRQYEPWAKEFERRFPGIQVKITGGYSGALAARRDELQPNVVSPTDGPGLRQWRRTAVGLRGEHLRTA